MFYFVNVFCSQDDKEFHKIIKNKINSKNIFWRSNQKKELIKSIDFKIQYGALGIIFNKSSGEKSLSHQTIHFIHLSIHIKDAEFKYVKVDIEDGQITFSELKDGEDATRYMWVYTADKIPQIIFFNRNNTIILTLDKFCKIMYFQQDHSDMFDYKPIGPTDLGSPAEFSERHPEILPDMFKNIKDGVYKVTELDNNIIPNNNNIVQKNNNIIGNNNIIRKDEDKKTNHSFNLNNLVLCTTIIIYLMTFEINLFI